MEMMNQTTGASCNDTQGTLPSCAPLANPYVPYQEEGAQTYQANTGFIRGTMYPGLDLPFMGMVNQKEKTGTSLHRLQSMHFAITELGLYLDTHADDEEATELFNQYVEQYADALQQYERKHGSTTQMGAALTGKFEWLDGPWPWEYNANQEG